MTTTLRPLFSIVVAAFIALSLITTTMDAVAGTGTHNGGAALFDQGFVDRSQGFFHPRPVGRFGVTWD